MFENKFGHMSCCSGTPNPKFYFDPLLFHLAQGLRKSLISANFFTFLKVSSETKFIPYRNRNRNIYVLSAHILER